MLIKVATSIYLEVADHPEADVACSTLESGLPNVLADFPHGEVVSTRVQTYELVSDEEAEREGLTE